jgi:uncharacterized protein YndB with AHSA1/START domain
VSVDVTVETVIARPPERVAAVMLDPAHDREWIKALTSAKVLTGGPVGVGTQVERVAAFLGRRMVYVNEIVEYEPPRLLEMRSIKAPFAMTVTYEIEPADGESSVVRIHTGGDASGFYALATPLLSLAVKAGVARDLRVLKALVEGAG